MITHPTLKRNAPETTKQRLFRYFHSLVYEYRISHYFVTFLLFVQTLQISYFAIHPVCCALWSLSAFQVVQKIMGVIAGSYIWRLGEGSLLLALNIFFLVILLTVGLIILYEVHNSRSDFQKMTTNVHELRTKLMQYAACLLRTIFVIPLVSLQMYSIVSSLKNNSSTSVILISISTCSFILLTALIFLFVNLFIDNSPFSRFSLAGPISIVEKLKNILKITLGILDGVLDISCNPNADSFHMAMAIIVILVLVYILYLIYVEPNLIHNIIRKSFEHEIIALTSLYIMIVIQKAVSFNSNINICFILIVTVGINICWTKAKEMREDMLIFSQYKSLTTKNQILAYNYLVCQLIRDFYMQPLCLLKLEGILSDHAIHCKKVEDACNCQGIKKKIKAFLYEKDQIQSAKQAPLWFSFFKINLQINAQKMNHQPEFHLILSYIEKTILKNNFVSYSHLEKCSLKQQSLAIEFLIYNQKRMIEKIFVEEDIKNNQKKQADVNKFIQMINLVENFNEIILKSSLEHLDFWKSLMKRKKDKSIIMKEGNVLLNTVKQCEQNYKKIKQSYPLNLESIVLFSNFSKYILNNHDLIQKNRSLFKMIKKKLNRVINMSGEQQRQKYTENSITGTIIISGERSNVGIIKHCTSKVTKILKYASYELIGQNINTIMPKFLGHMHNEVLIKYLQQAQSQSNFVERLAPMIDKNGFMILSRIMTKPIPSLINGLEIIGIFQKVKQKNARYMNEAPKYLLYRCDTGNIEALSENFYNYYGYRIMKVSQFSEISEELNFNNIFSDISMSSMKKIEDGIQCQLKLKKNSKKSIRIKVYVRMELVYFGTAIRLLSIFSFGDGNFNSITIQNSMAANPATQVALSQRSETQEVNGQQQTAKSIDNPNLNQNKNKNEQILSQDELKQLQNKIPFKFRVFQILLFIFFIINVIISAFQFRFNVEQTSLVLSYIDHSQWISNSLIYLINVGYFSRMMHLSSKFPERLPYFGQYRSNVSVSTDNLQKSEFWLTNKQNSYSSFLQFQFPNKTLIWQLSEQNNVSYKKQALSLNIFDLVTSSSLFNSAKSKDFDFNFLLTNDPAAALTSSYIRNLFKIRYSSIYELIPAKQNYAKKMKQSYIQRINYYEKVGNIEIGIASGAFILFLLIMLKIVYNIIRSIFSVTSLFNWLTHLEIQKQINRCQTFLEHFFVNSYEVGLRLNKSKILRGHSFQDSRLIDIDKVQHQNLMRTGNNVQEQQPQVNNFESKDRQGESHDNECAQSIDIVNMEQNIAKQKSISTRINNKNQELVPLKVSDSEELIDQEVENVQALEIGDLTIATPLLLGLCVLLVYFIGVHLLSKRCLQRTIVQISNQNLIQRTLQTLDELKYYSLESVVDSQNFQGYRNIRIEFDELSQQIYKLQQQLNQFSDVDDKVYPLQELLYNNNLNGVCSDSFLDFQYYSTKSYSLQECLNADQGVLSEGLRASIVAYIQNIKNTTHLSSILELVQSQSMRRILVYDKYIKSSIRKIMAKNKESSKNYFEQENKITISLFSLFILVVVLVIMYIYFSTNKDLKLKILGTYQIVSLIPQRIFKKNSNLCEEYRKNVKELME